MEGEKYPKPEIDPNFYIKNNICPICCEKLEYDYIPHPNAPEMGIHKLCLIFIQNHWICRTCREYFSFNEKQIHLVETGIHCQSCADKFYKNNALSYIDRVKNWQ